MKTGLELGLAELSQAVNGPRESANERAALDAQVEFAPEHPAEEARPLAPRPVTAVLVVHGMGQQLPFETLDALANGLYREDMRSHGETGIRPATVAHVQLGQESLERVEMQLRKSPSTFRDVHLYEAYWAPLTEGAVNLRDVVGFLINAGLNGIKNSRGYFSRWSFGKMRNYNIPLHTLLYLVVALLTVGALVALNTAISAVAAANALYSSPPAWLTEKLFSDYSTILSLVVGALELFTIAIAFGMLLSSGRRRLTKLLSGRICQALMLAVGILSVLLFAVSIIVLVDAASAAPMLVKTGAALPHWTYEVATVVQTWQLWIVVVAAIGAVVYFAWVVIRSYLTQVSSPDATRWPAVVALLFFVLLLGSLYMLSKGLVPSNASWMNTSRWSILLMWAVLIALSFVVRMFLVQYVGDVVAYVQPHTLDRFFELRTKIKDRVLKIAEAIYSQRSDGQHFDYQKVVLVGHSLGSVIVYDTLNRLLLDDAAKNDSGRPWDVELRSPYLLTFGSPLNKTAFLFATQSKKWSMTLARERLAALVQPLADSEVIRAGIKWVNIYSPWDIISGRLNFYDPPPGGKALPVLDEPDGEAITFLAAHTEYWRNKLVFAWLHAMV